MLILGEYLVAGTKKHELGKNVEAKNVEVNENTIRKKENGEGCGCGFEH